MEALKHQTYAPSQQVDWYEGNAARQIKQPVYDAEDQSLPTSQEDQLPRQVWQKGLTVLLAVAFLLSVFTNLYLQWQTIQIDQQMTEYSATQAELDEEMAIMLNEIAQSFDYNRIKQIAQDNGMQQERERVKEISQ